MYTDDDLNSAVEAGVFTQESVNSFRELMDKGRLTHHQDEENFRLLSSFNDIFVLIACSLILFPVFAIVKDSSLSAAFASVMVLSWILGEYFILRRKMALPAVFLVLSCVISAINLGSSLGQNATMEILLSVSFGVVVAVAHWFRFRVPITIAGGIAATVFMVMIIVLERFPDAMGVVTFTAFVCGILVFCLAMVWDSKDTQRVTYRSDVAFWLHLVAAPLMVHPVFFFMGFYDDSVASLSIAVVLGLYACITLVSVVIDRRSLMVSSLVYVLITVARVLTEQQAVVESFSVVAVVMGIVLLALSVFWQLVRRKVVAGLPLNLRQILPAIR